MTYTVKIRTLPGSPMMAEYDCPLHGRYELLVSRDENGDPPFTLPCPIDADEGLEDDGLDPTFGQYECGLDSDLVISAPSIKFWSRDPVPIGYASKSDEKDPRALDTEPLATGKMTKAEWRKYQRGITQERRHQRLLKSGKRSKRIQVGGG